MKDSTLWEEAYKTFKLQNTHKNQLTNRPLKRKARRLKKIAHIKFNVAVTSETITETTKEFYRWKKTNGYEKWRKSRFLKQGGLCFYCEDWLPLTRVHVEHIVPRSKGGLNHSSNLVLSCSHCNKDKGSRMLTEAQILELKSRSKKNNGTYLKNKEYFENLYGQYLDNSFNEMIMGFKN